MFNSFGDDPFDVPAREAYMEERFDVPVDGCIEEFGPHTDHEYCGSMLSQMRGDDSISAVYNPRTGQWDHIY